MNGTVELIIDGKPLALPTVVGTEGEVGIDISALRAKTGCITLDPGYGNTGACKSAITFIDGEKGILQYRGYDIAELAKKSTFVETAYLLIYGELPTAAELQEFSGQLTENQMLHQDMQHHFGAFPPKAHPMSIPTSPSVPTTVGSTRGLPSMINSTVPFMRRDPKQLGFV